MSDDHGEDLVKKALAEHRRAKPIDILGVRRWGEDEITPIVLDHRSACGTLSDHCRRGCIGIVTKRGGSEGMIHLTTEEALRLSYLLRAMADTNAEAGP